MPSTPKHLIIYDAFGWQPPVFAHVGLLQDENGQKLSKRNLDIDIQSFEKDGIFPEALVNYVSLLGWSHSLGTDLLPSKPLIENVNREHLPISHMLMLLSLTSNLQKEIL